jgi:hypothetical protein
MISAIEKGFLMISGGAREVAEDEPVYKNVSPSKQGLSRLLTNVNTPPAG